MRFTIKREEFLKGLSTASRAIASNVALAVLANLKIELDENGLFITGSNSDLTIKTLVPYKSDDVEVIRNYKEGGALIQAKILTEAVRRMESEEVTLDVVDSTIATLSDSRSNYRLNCIRVEEYPDIDLEANGTELVLSKDDFNALVSQTAFAASVKDQRPILTAIHLAAGDGILAQPGILVAVASDASRVAYKQIKIDPEVRFVANVPAKFMTEVNRLAEGCETLNVSFGDKKALFAVGRSIIATRLIAGDYPKVESVLRQATSYRLEINASELLKSIDRVTILSEERQNPVTMNINDEFVEITARSSKVGSATERIDVFKYEGQNISRTFNSEFVAGALKALNAEDVTFDFPSDEKRAFVIKNVSDDSTIQVVSAMRSA